MENEKTEKNESFLNVTLKNSEEEKEDIIISFSGIIKQLKRFLLIWLAVAILAGVLIPTGYAVFASDQLKVLNAVISFNYDGIESGKDPNGRTFDVNTLKNPAVIEKALTDLGEDMEQLENIRQGIIIEGIRPTDAIDKITMYQSIYQQGNLTAGEKMLEVKIYPTQFIVTFNYSATDYKGTRAVEVFNTILTSYSEYFFDTYGFNKALGSAVTTLDYNDYDYAQAVDVFDSTLSTLQDYVNGLSSSDSTRFRASSTGNTFADLSESIGTLREVDLDVISSYINIHTITKDKETLLAYYDYRVEQLNRQKKIAEDELKTVTEAIADYEKDTIIIYGDKQDTSQYTQASAEYDNLINRKISAQKTVSTAAQRIDMYQKRITELNKNKTSASKEKIERVEADLQTLSEKINVLLQKVNDTANEYYETVYLSNSYNILVPASSSALHTAKSIIKAAMEPVLIVEALFFVIYFAAAFISALIADNRKKNKNNPVQQEFISAEPAVSVKTEEETKE